MRLYCSSSLHKKGYCIRKYKGIELQSVTQIVVANLNKKVNNLINCEDVTKLLEKSHKNRDVQVSEKIIRNFYNNYKDIYPLNGR